jgi:hypothetical protein
MDPPIHLKPEATVALPLTAPERRLILALLLATTNLLDRIRGTPPGEKTVSFTPDEVEGLVGYVASQANHAKDRRLQKKLDLLFEKIRRRLDKSTEKEPPTPAKGLTTKQGGRNPPAGVINMGDWLASRHPGGNPAVRDVFAENRGFRRGKPGGTGCLSLTQAHPGGPPRRLFAFDPDGTGRLADGRRRTRESLRKAVVYQSSWE